MKSIIKLIVIIFFSNYSFSQIYYSHYLDETSEWKVLEHRGDAGYHNCEFKTLFFDGFQNINGYTYYKMYKTYYNIGYEVDYSNIIYPQTANQTQFVCYLREDPTGNFYINSGVSEILHFDNQFVVNSQLGDMYSPFNCPIDFVGTIINNGLNLKLIKGHSDDVTTGQALEGVGNINYTCFSSLQQDFSLSLFQRIYHYSRQGQNLAFYDNVYTPVAGQNGFLFYYSFPPSDHQILNLDFFLSHDRKTYWRYL